ncbi:MAG: hypothetical protein ABIQ90_02850, partial [Polaromonas sp.]
MDSQIFPVLMAAASFLTGLLLCWLVMRGRTSAAAALPVQLEVQSELVRAQARCRSLEEDCQRAAASDDRNRQALQSMAARLAELEHDNAALQHQITLTSLTLEAFKASP